MNIRSNSAECVVCFEHGSQNVKCCDNTCDTLMCVSCAKEYLDLCLEEKRIPRCPNVNCEKYYLQNDFIKFGHLLPTYNKCCLLELVNENGEEARKNWAIIDNLNKLRQARKVFLDNKFPAAIAFTASNILPRKLKTLDQQLTKKLQGDVKLSKKRCINTACDGYLNDDFKCITCETVFCKECEKKLSHNHKCDQNDKETINFMKGVIKCPSCMVPVLRSQGCNNMTCSNCGTNFLYDSGYQGGSGAHGNLKIEIREKLLLSGEYNSQLSKLGLLDLMLKIESLEPMPLDTEVINKILIKFYKNKEHLDNKDLDTLAAKFSELVLSNLSKNKYVKILIQIEEHLKTNTLTNNFLQRQIMELQ